MSFYKFSTTLVINDKEVEAVISGFYEPAERATFSKEEVLESFEAETILVYSDDLHPLDIKDILWILPSGLLDEVKEEFFKQLKGDDDVL